VRVARDAVADVVDEAGDRGDLGDAIVVAQTAQGCCPLCAP